MSKGRRLCLKIKYAPLLFQNKKNSFHPQKNIQYVSIFGRDIWYGYLNPFQINRGVPVVIGHCIEKRLYLSKSSVDPCWDVVNIENRIIVNGSPYKTLIPLINTDVFIYMYN